MMETCLNIAICGLIGFTVVFTIKAVCARNQAQERQNAILGIVMSVIGIGFALLFQYTRLSIWHFLIVGGALLLIHRELQDQQRTDMSLYGRSLRYRLVTILGGALALLAFLHAPGILKLILAVLVAVFLMNRQKIRTRIVKPHLTSAPESVPDTPLHADDKGVEVTSEVTKKADPDQITASYAHPSTGMAHTDAALQVYVSSKAGPAKARARRIIIAGLTKTTAFKSGDEQLDAALVDIVVSHDPGLLQEKSQAVSARLHDLIASEAVGLDTMIQKVLATLHIVQIIAEDQEKQSRIQETERLIKTMEAETPSAQNGDCGSQPHDTAADPGAEPNAPS